MSHAAEAPIIRVAQVVPCTEAEGPGRRFAVWFQGCPLRCPGCCNPEFLSFNGGESVALADLTRSPRSGPRKGRRRGHHPARRRAVRPCRSRGRPGRVRPGPRAVRHGLQRLHPRTAPRAKPTGRPLALGEYGHPGGRPLPAGPTRAERRWVGSRNQRIHFLSGRYRADDPRWRERNTLEIRVDRTGIAVNGFPARRRRRFGRAGGAPNGPRTRRAHDRRRATAGPGEEPREVSRFEYNLLRILRFLLGPLPRRAGASTGADAAGPRRTA